MAKVAVRRTHPFTDVTRGPFPCRIGFEAGQARSACGISPIFGFDSGDDNGQALVLPLLAGSRANSIEGVVAEAEPTVGDTGLQCLRRYRYRR